MHPDRLGVYASEPALRRSAEPPAISPSPRTIGSQRPRPVKASWPPLRTVAKTAWLSGFLTLASAALAPRCDFGFACDAASAPLTPAPACPAAVPVADGWVDTVGATPAVGRTLAGGMLVSPPTVVVGVVQAAACALRACTSTL